MNQIVKVPSENQEQRRDDEVFHIAIGPVIVFANIFGIMPVTEVTSRDVTKIRFKWLSIQVFVSVFLIILGCGEIFLTFVRMAARGLKLYSVGATTFYLVCEIAVFLFFRLATKWPEIVRLWRKTDMIFLQNAYRMYNKTSLKSKIRYVTIIMLFFALVEHGMYLCTSFLNSQKQIDQCNFTFGIVENMFRRERTHIFDQVHFKMWMVPLLEYVNISMTLCWNFTDIFITIVSIGMATRFKQLTKRLEMTKGKIMPESFWMEIRNHYIAQSDLVMYMDDQLSGLILLSCANNLYQICVTLFNSFREIPGTADKIYFWYSLSFILVRTMCVLFSAASINDSSRGPIPILRNISSTSWSTEVQRFTTQVTKDVVALSGKKFFFLTRKLILAMVGTIITYEIVLQDRVQEYTDIKNFCQIYGKA